MKDVNSGNLPTGKVTRTFEVPGEVGPLGEEVDCRSECVPDHGLEH
jgi:hypothetical protein